MKRLDLLVMAAFVVLGVVHKAGAQRPAPSPANVPPGTVQPVSPVISWSNTSPYQYEPAVSAETARWPELTSKDNEQERKIQEILSRFRAVEDGAERSDLERDLSTAVDAQFELRFERHELEVKELEEKVKRLREQLQRRRDNQREIVDFRVQQLMREAEGLGWGNGASQWGAYSETAPPRYRSRGAR